MKGLETLSLRTDRQIDSAKKVADYLVDLENINGVIYPGHKSHPEYSIAQKQMTGGGPIVTFKVNGGKKEAFDFLNKLALIKISNNLGDARTLITHPKTTTHRNLSEAECMNLGITDSTLRMSLGLEDIDDIIADIDKSIR